MYYKNSIFSTRKKTLMLACPKVIDAVLLLQNCRYSSEEKVFPEFTDWACLQVKHIIYLTCLNIWSSSIFHLNIIKYRILGIKYLYYTLVYNSACIRMWVISWDDCYRPLYICIKHKQTYMYGDNMNNNVFINYMCKRGVNILTTL
jgi:hypothetical protein